VEARPGGANGGGASLTEAGTDVVRRYRAIESNVETNSSAHISALEKMVVSAKRKPRSGA
jgi:molybdate transport repressor ModE-like protein